MYIRFDDKDKGKRFTFFRQEREINGEKVTHTERTVFGNLSEGIKTGENNGQPIWENDYWNAAFCGKAYELALTLHNKDRIVVTEMNVRNICRNKKSYPQIMVTEFHVVASQHNSEETYQAEEKGDFMPIPEEMNEELPFN